MRNYPAIIVRQRHRSETNVIAERAVRRVKEGTSAVSLQSGLDKEWWADSMECYTYLRNVTDLSSVRTSYTVWSNGGISPYSCERPIEITSIWPGFFLDVN